MSNTYGHDYRLATLGRVAAISMALIIPAVAELSTAAQADDEYGTTARAEHSPVGAVGPYCQSR
jgi:hypothetical protein